ncbi:hypothetical protein [Thermoanaerobacter indiensis]|uniref:hypothetical protein n=1 Tax=Thermoanaerobacter indiensis TaxID=1125974 RepID=UPI0003699243
MKVIVLTRGGLKDKSWGVKSGSGNPCSDVWLNLEKSAEVIVLPLSRHEIDEGRPGNVREVFGNSYGTRKILQRLQTTQQKALSVLEQMEISRRQREVHSIYHRSSEDGRNGAVQR